MTSGPAAAPGGGAPDALPFDALGRVEVVGRLADGKSTTVYRARLDGGPVALKVFKPRAIRRHARRHDLPVAEFEYRRNRAFREAPGLAGYIARPHGFFRTPGIQAVVQELLEGELYYHHRRRALAEGRETAELFAEVRRIVELAHAADLYDLDLHALNVMVVREGGRSAPRLFDFNAIPFYEAPRNPLEALLLRAGILGRDSRDLRKLRQFHDFSRMDRKRRRSYSP